MVFRKPKATKTKRTFKKKMVPKPKVTVSRDMAVFGKGLPKTAVVTHRYVATCDLVNALGATAYCSYRCNGMFDPEVALGGHQPLYFDQMSALYHHYTVIGAKINIKLSGSSNALDNVPVAVCLQQHPGATPVAFDPMVAAEQNYAKIKVLSTDGSGGTLQLNSKWSAKKTFKGSILGNDELKGSPTTDPVEQSYWTVSSRPIDITTATAQLFVVTIDYIAVWRELKQVPQS